MIRQTSILALPLATVLTLAAGAAPTMAGPSCPGDHIADLQRHWHRLIAEGDPGRRSPMLQEHQALVDEARQAVSAPIGSAAGQCRDRISVSRVHLRNMVEMHQAMLDMLME